MGVFITGDKNTAAAEAALKINYFFSKVLKPAFTNFYSSTNLSLMQTVGIETSKVMVVRSGIRNNNDLVWVGRAPNIAAKLSAIREGYATYISKAVFDSPLDDSKYGGEPKKLMWKLRSWDKGKAYGVDIIYQSDWWWRP